MLLLLTEGREAQPTFNNPVVLHGTPGLDLTDRHSPGRQQGAVSQHTPPCQGAVASNVIFNIISF